MRYYRKLLSVFLICGLVSGQTIHSIEGIGKLDLLPESKLASKYPENSTERRNPFFVQSLNTVLRFYNCDTLSRPRDINVYDTTALYYLDELYKRDIILYRFDKTPTYLLKAAIDSDIPVLLFGHFSTTTVSHIGVSSDVLYQYGKPDMSRPQPKTDNPEYTFLTARLLTMYGRKADEMMLMGTDSSAPFRYFQKACVLGSPNFTIDSILTNIRTSLQSEDLTYPMPVLEMVTASNFFSSGTFPYNSEHVSDLRSAQRGYGEENSAAAKWIIGGIGIATVATFVAIILGSSRRSEPVPLPAQP